MNKLILVLLFVTGSLFAQTGASFKFGDVGTWWIPRFQPFGTPTTFTDSTNYVTLNKGFYVRDSLVVGADFYAKGKVYLDTNREGSLYFSGDGLYLQNDKSGGYSYFYTTGRNSGYNFMYSASGSNFLFSLDTSGAVLYGRNFSLGTTTGQIKVPTDTASDFNGDDAITLNRQSGRITTKSLTTAAQDFYSLTLTNSLITANSHVFVTWNDGTKSAGISVPYQTRPSNGSCVIVIWNADASDAFNGTMICDFIIFN